MILNFNYDLAIRQATQIEGVAGEMRKLANVQMTNAIATIDASWDGDTSNVFLQHCNETKQQIATRAAEFENLARRIREVARILRDAEERARREMEIFSGGGSSGSSSSGGSSSGGGRG